MRMITVPGPNNEVDLTKFFRKMTALAYYEIFDLSKVLSPIRLLFRIKFLLLIFGEMSLEEVVPLRHAVNLMLVPTLTGTG